ncbi:unnamed protein product [Schistosoma mattheei]|uniref:Uncharacterized protein n=1 Tax=Schistosoma mattheei TaxID=31246 RepID=A0A183PV09_9TREM|nr:unnamed protein product [Schistosoma mattheei]
MDARIFCVFKVVPLGILTIYFPSTSGFIRRRTGTKTPTFLDAAFLSSDEQSFDVVEVTTGVGATDNVIPISFKCSLSKSARTELLIRCSTKIPAYVSLSLAGTPAASKNSTHSHRSLNNMKFRENSL